MSTCWGPWRLRAGENDSREPRAPICCLQKNIQDLAPTVMQKIRIRKHSTWATVGRSSLFIPFPSFCMRCSSLDLHMQPFGCMSRTTLPAHQPCSPEWHTAWSWAPLSKTPILAYTGSPSIPPTHSGISVIPDNLPQLCSLPAVAWGTQGMLGPFPCVMCLAGRRKCYWIVRWWWETSWFWFPTQGQGKSGTSDFILFLFPVILTLMSLTDTQFE